MRGGLGGRLITLPDCGKLFNRLKRDPIYSFFFVVFFDNPFGRTPQRSREIAFGLPERVTHQNGKKTSCPAGWRGRAVFDLI
jgi:hypothetical protein